MSDVVLVLGPVAFSDFEIPERIQFGGAQRLAVHKLPGGQRVIDALGRDDCEITWCGIFAGPDATERARLLDLLRAQGALLPLTWDVFFYTAVICSFEAEYSKNWWIPYRITCTVLRDEAGGLIDFPVAPGNQPPSDIAAAAVLTSGTGIDLSPLQAAIAAPAATTPGSAAYLAAQGIAGQAQAQIGSDLAAAEAQLSAAAPAAVPMGQGSVNAGIAAIGEAAKAAAQLGVLAAARGYLGRAIVNLANPQS